MTSTEIAIVRDDDLVRQYQVKSDGSPINITGYTFKFAVKEYLGATAPLIEVDGDIVDGPDGKFSFDLFSAVTGMAPFCGLYEIAMIDTIGQKTTLTVAGGAKWELVQKITTAV